ncbi:MAG: hypothetical protein KAJ13_11995 [Gemmatimonadetes bacterium]|nr:hypothetical protein [Gemmatimonadota bacterium]
MRLRKGTTGWSRGQRAIATGLIIVLAGFAGACNGSPTDTLNQDSSAELSEADFSVVLGDLTEGLGLTDDQAAAVQEVMDKYRGQGREPGALWYAAADLQGVLTSDQIAVIDARRDELRAEASALRGEMRGRRGKRSGDGQASGERRGFGPHDGLGGGEGFGGRDGDGPRGPGDILDLSDEQLAQLEAIRESHAPEMEEIREALRDGSLTRDEARDRMAVIQDAMHGALQGILTDDQLALLEEHRAEAEAKRGEVGARREGMRARWEQRSQAAHAAMIAALDLTPEQVAAIDALRVRSEGEGRPSAEEMEARRDEHHQALLDILDDDQEEIWILHGSLSGLFARHQARSRAGDGFGGEGRRGRRGSGGV